MSRPSPDRAAGADSAARAPATSPSHADHRLAAELIALLHRNAPAEDFGTRLAQAEQLPDALPDKTGCVELVHMAMALRNRLELHEQRERGMLAVVESAQDLSSRLDLDSLLGAVVKRARHLMGAHLCWLTIYDQVSGEFQVITTEGALSQRTGRMTAGRDLGVAGVVMSTRLPFFTPDYLHDNRFAHDPVLDDTFRDEGVAALAGVPLIWDNEVTGLLFVADRYHRTHTALNLSILCTLATHAAVAIHNARAFRAAREALDKADQARADLERHARDVQGAAEAHEQLTSLLARGAPLDLLCQTVARLLDGSVLVLDEAREAIARADAPGGHSPAAQAYLPNDAHSAALAQVLHDSRRSGRSALAWCEGEECVRATAVIGGDELLGAVLLFRREDLSATAVRTFERSASIIATVLLSQERLQASQSRDVLTLLHSLLAPRQDEPALAQDRAARFGLDLAQPLALLLVEGEAARPGLWTRRLHGDTALAERVRGEIDGILAVVCSATRAQEAAAAVGDFARRVLGEAYRGVRSRPVQSAGELPALYAALRRALGVVGRLGMHGRIADQNELALYSVLFETHDQTSLQIFLHATVGPLLQHDAQRGTDLAATLLAYLDGQQNARATAVRLGIHVNTVRQRLATAESLIGHWGSASRALELHMALRLWRLGMVVEA